MEGLVIGFIFFAIANFSRILVCIRFQLKQKHHCWYVQSLTNLFVSAVLFLIVFIAEDGISFDDYMHRFFGIYLGVSLLSVFALLIYQVIVWFKRKYYKNSKSRLVIHSIFILIIISMLTLYDNDKTYREISDACYDASYASTLDKRTAFLEKAYALEKKMTLVLPAVGWSNPIKVCHRVTNGLDNLIENKICTNVIIKDVACQCGQINWDPENPVINCNGKTQCYRQGNTFIVRCNSNLERMRK